MFFSVGGHPQERNISVEIHSEPWFEDKHLEIVKNSVKKWVWQQWQNCQLFNVPKPALVFCQAFVSPLLLQVLRWFEWKNEMKTTSALPRACALCHCSDWWLQCVLCVFLLCCWRNHFQVTFPERKLIIGRLVEEKNPRQMVKETHISCFILQIVINFSFVL